MRSEINILLIADIMGRPGRRAVEAILPRLREEYSLDFIIANGENSAGGYGLTEKVAHELFDLGIDCLTSGNHIWEQKGILPYLDSEPRILRPINYPSGAPGRGSGIFESSGFKVGVVNLEGRLFMKNIDCPFSLGFSAIQRVGEETSIIIVDFHAEATSEKKALGWYMDGKVTAVIGTHTHVQTADETVLPGGTAYITDCGMTGAFDSVIGVNKEKAIENFINQIPRRLDLGKKDIRLDGVVIVADSESGRAASIVRIEEALEE